MLRPGAGLIALRIASALFQEVAAIDTRRMQAAIETSVGDLGALPLSAPAAADICARVKLKAAVYSPASLKGALGRSTSMAGTPFQRRGRNIPVEVPAPKPWLTLLIGSTPASIWGGQVGA